MPSTTLDQRALGERSMPPNSMHQSPIFSKMLSAVHVPWRPSCASGVHSKRLDRHSLQRDFQTEMNVEGWIHTNYGQDRIWAILVSCHHLNTRSAEKVGGWPIRGNQRKWMVRPFLTRYNLCSCDYSTEKYVRN